MMKMSKKLFALALLLSTSLFGNVYAAEENAFANKIESIDFSALAGGRVSIRVHLNEALANPPASFTLNNPARIALDFPQIGNGLAKSNIPSEQGALKSVSLAQAKDRTRMVLNLSKNVGYNTTLNGKDVIITSILHVVKTAKAVLLLICRMPIQALISSKKANKLLLILPILTYRQNCNVA
jgi:type IV pilus assembly protein PilQ